MPGAAGRLTREKLAQAQDLVAASGADLWMTFVRETAAGADPALALILEGSLTWHSALIVTRDGRRIAVVGNFDADPLRASGDWDEVIPYTQGIRAPLLELLERLIPRGATRPRIAVNYSCDDPQADGLTHGMFLHLVDLLHETRFADALESAEEILTGLRSRKTREEIRRIRAAIAETDQIFDAVEAWAAVGVSEREVYDAIQTEIAARGLGYGWDRSGDPIVNSGPDSMIGHGTPSPEIRIAPGHVFHIDLGVVVAGYSSDIQRCWYVPRAGERDIPDDVTRALNVVCRAISAGAEQLRPGIEGWRVDEAARSFITAHGYPEYMHALGHQVGRMAHDGGALLGPRWERYGRAPLRPVCENQVFTLELGVIVEERGYLGIEEMVLVTEHGHEWLTQRQLAMRFLPHPSASAAADPHADCR